MRAELRYRGVVARSTPLFALKQRNHDVLFSAAPPRRSPARLLRIPEQILSCLAYGRYKISQGQIARVAATLQRTRAARSASSSPPTAPTSRGTTCGAGWRSGSPSAASR